MKECKYAEVKTRALKSQDLDREARIPRLAHQHNPNHAEILVGLIEDNR
jgi:hypothetical protein